MQEVIRLEGRPSRSSVQQALILPFIFTKDTTPRNLYGFGGMNYSDQMIFHRLEIRAVVTLLFLMMLKRQCWFPDGIHMHSYS